MMCEKMLFITFDETKPSNHVSIGNHNISNSLKKYRAMFRYNKKYSMNLAVQLCSFYRHIKADSWFEIFGCFPKVDGVW